MWPLAGVFSDWVSPQTEQRRTRVPPEVQVKAAGGIRTVEDFLAYVDAGATRIGCSAGIPIVEALRKQQ